MDKHPFTLARAAPVKRFLLIFLAVFLLRLPVLHRAVLDWDETIYLMTARDWLAGHLPYTVVWDNKPPGIYAIFAIFQSLIPGIAAIRLATVFCEALLAWTVGEIARALGGGRQAGWATAFLVMLCSLSNDGLSANTELFMDVCTALAVLAVLRGASGGLAGLLLGCGFVIKYVCAPEILVVLALLWQRRGLRPVIAACLAATLPSLAFALLYAAAGQLHLLWNCAVAANFRRAGAPFAFHRLKFQAARWAMLYVAAGWAMLHPRRLARPAWFLPAWLLASGIGAVSAKSFYDHYFLQMLPPLSLAAGLLFARLPPRPAPRLAFLALISLQPAIAAAVAFHRATGPDPEREGARALRVAGATSLYVFDAQPVLYLLTGLPAPSYYAFPPELTDTVLAKTAGVDAPREVARILATRPEFIVRSSWARDSSQANPLVYKELGAALAARYRLWKRLPGNDIYRLNPPSIPPAGR